MAKKVRREQLPRKKPGGTRALVAAPPKKPGGTRALVAAPPDMRTVTGRVVAQLVQDQGGQDAISHARFSLLVRVAHLETLLSHEEQAIREGKKVNVGEYRQNINSLVGLYRTVGIERRARPVKRLSEIVAEGKAK